MKKIEEQDVMIYELITRGIPDAHDYALREQQSNNSCCT